MRRLSFLFVVFAFSAVFAFGQNVTQGSLYASGKNGVLGECPLKNTSVRADISGFLARVTVVQEFENNFTEPIEAVYTFPLSQNSAVDAMTMRIGERTIRGRIMKREEARAVYEKAKTEGKTASLLDQQRPNIFTQSVANILPNQKILIEISYVETLKYEDGQYEFVFPMTVGPRYTPPSANATETQKVTPPVAETRSGGDISIEVNLDAGVPMETVFSVSHPIAMTNLSPNSAKISLREEKTIPNKDFILRYDITGKRIEDAILTHRADKGGFFSLILSPPDKFTDGNYTPKEIVFVLDTSGSMSGFPIEKAKEAMRLSLDGLNPQDTFNLITFAGDTAILFPAPVPATADNLARAKAFLESRQGSGGTEMMKAVTAALAPTESQKHLRVVCFMTDGYVGNEAEIIAEIQKYPKARIFAFGIGNSVNRYLLDKMAQEGRGEVDYVSLKEDGSKAAQRFFERVRTPVMTDISIEWNGMPVEDVYPQNIGDLFSAKPLVLNGRFTRAARGTIRLKGFVAGRLLVRDIPVNLPDNEPQHDVLATLWARRRVDAMMSDYYKNLRDEKAKNEVQEQITALGIEFGILTQFTSFVAVEEQVVNQNGKPTRTEVPVIAPEGMKMNSGVINTQDSSLGNVFPARQVTNLPVNTRSSTQLVTLQPGATADSKSKNVKSESSGRGDGDSNSQSSPSLLYRIPNNAENSLATDDKEKTKSPSDTASGSVLEVILSRVEAHQKALKSLRAEITMEKFDSQINQTDTSNGTVIYAPQANNPALRIDWTQPLPETLSVFNKSFVLYRPRLQTAYTGKTDAFQKSELAFLQTLTKESITANFSLKSIGAENINNGATAVWHLALTPKKQSNYKTIELWIDGSGMINQVKITETNGDWTYVLLTNLQKNTTVKSSDFMIELPKETKIIKN